MKSLVKKAFVRRSFINQVTTCELMTPMVATIGRMVTLSRFLTLFRFDPGALGFSNQFFLTDCNGQTWVWSSGNPRRPKID